MDQSARLKMLAAFRNSEVTYLIASDVAARGLDIPEVSHVFNFDVPIHAEDYVHRVGRTGRAGREGHAFTMVTREEAKHLKAIETLITEMKSPGIGIGAPEENAAHSDGKGPERMQRKPSQHRENLARRTAAAKPAAAKPSPTDDAAKRQSRSSSKPETAARATARERSATCRCAGYPAASTQGNMPAFLSPGPCAARA